MSECVIKQKDTFFAAMRRKSAKTPKKIVYPEGDDERVILAVKEMLEMGM